MQSFLKLISFIARIGETPEDSAETRTARAMLNVGFSAANVLCIIMVGPLYLLFNEPLAAASYIGFGVFTFANMALFSRHKNYHIFAATMAVVVPLSNVVTILALGNFIHAGGAVLWSILYPVIGMLILYGVRRAVLWSLPVIAVFALNIFAEPVLRQEINLPETMIQLILFTNLISIFSITIAVMGYFVTQRDVAFKLLAGEQQKAENLLLSILPKEIADILKEEHRTIAEHYDGASILFADIVNFTPLSASMAPIELVEMLNSIFTHFDNIVESYDLEKIKTIGDCYMVAAGVPRSRPDHAHVLVRMALEIQDFIGKNEFGGKRIAFRIGINSGSVVAGVIGRKKFIYDLWGDAVNTASRMESHGGSGIVQISRSTYELVKDNFICEPRGMINVKGKGEMEVWHVMGAKKKQKAA